jgi:hypothetical protein
MKRPSLPLTALIIFWFVYDVAAAYTLYQALPRLNRELLLILGAAAIFPVVATFTFLLYAHSRHSIDDRNC